ncbi:hypothetical protein N9N28_10120 [Rubripirellula amarantea]|nr:hypothetical protein [Rubripirellula amarantea]MDA8744975.1 hypothetical protein [Rubripirellula amarantea]
MDPSKIKVGDWVIYRKQKSSKAPGPRAVDVRASSGGETYQYMVDKFWVVEEVHDDGILLRTRRGKQNTIPFDDPRLRIPSWWEKLIYRQRFLEVANGNELSTSDQ